MVHLTLPNLLSPQWAKYIIYCNNWLVNYCVNIDGTPIILLLRYHCTISLI